jgi:hypothetical protein
MGNRSRSIPKVEDLERFGKSLSDFPKEAFQGQGKVIFAAFRNKFGLFGLVPFAFRVVLERRRILKQYAKQYDELVRLTGNLAKEPLIMIAIFNVIARTESREQAYEFVKGIFQIIALKSLPAIYQLDDLVKCEGDVFDNFKKFNVAMFKAGDRDYHVKEVEEDDNHLRIVVDSCLNVEIGKMFDCPEIAKLGCDHDLASYPFVDPAVDSEFRRPCTLAKGDEYCDFNFYWKGFAPQGAFENK